MPARLRISQFHAARQAGGERRTDALGDATTPIAHHGA